MLSRCIGKIDGCSQDEQGNTRAPPEDTVIGSLQEIAKSHDPSKWHRHDSAIFCFVDTGLIGISTEELSVLLSPGMAVYLPPGVLHRESLFTAKTSVWIVSIPASQCRNSLPKEMRAIELTELMLALCKRIAMWGNPDPRSKVQAQITDLLIDEIAKSPDSNYLQIPMPDHQRLRRSAKQIVASPQDMNSVDFWARHSGMSRRSFTRHFTKETGLPFVTWRRRVKMNSALQSLDEKASVSDVSLSLGYRNISTFISIFKKHFGLSPGRYRKQSRSRRR